MKPECNQPTKGPLDTSCRQKSNVARKLARERHERRTMVAFSDGHTEALRNVELYGMGMRKRWCNDNAPHDISQR
jgi:prepilin-type processing-associated H-X9-DG protein